jgi:osmotically-inducible protein OsmY
MMTTPAGQRVDQNIGERTLGSKIEDVNIEAKIRANFFKANNDYRRADLEVNSYNGIVLLTGTVPEQSLKRLASQIAKDTRRVRQVHNKLSVGKPLSPNRKTKDNWLGLRVKTKLLTSRLVPGKRIHVVTSDGVAYLMGLLSPIETKRAIESIAYMDGLKKIVKVFETVTPPESTQVARAKPAPQKQPSQPTRSYRDQRVTLP